MAIIWSIPKKSAWGIRDPQESRDQAPLDIGKEIFVINIDIARVFGRVWRQGISTKLKSLVICSNLLDLLQDCFQGRVLRLAVSGHPTESFMQCLCSKKGNVLGPLWWNICFDILKLITKEHTYVDCYNLAFICERSDREAIIKHQPITTKTQGVSWSSISLEKTKVLLIS